MLKVKKYLAVSVLLLALPLVAFIATHFVLESNKSIYTFIPQESDVVIEINTRNFISEIMYQRIYHENYFHSKIKRDEHAEPIKDVGFDMFSSIVIFREQWSSTNMWMALIGYTDEARFSSFLTTEVPEINYCFGDEYVLLQLTPYADSAKIYEHMKNIMAGNVESFSKQVDLTEIFDHKKEINCYITPRQNSNGNQLLNGNLSLDFLADQIKIDGEFTPVSGFSQNEPVAYELNEDAPFSLRSSLSILKSVYWFSDDNIKGIPQYEQIAFDYYSMKLFMVHEDLGYTFPFKQYPDMQLHFDIEDDYASWEKYFEALKTDKIFKVDTAAHILSTPMGTYFNYAFNKKVFQLMRNEIVLVPNENKNLYFIFHTHVGPILDNINLAFDQNNPPPNTTAAEKFRNDATLGIVEGRIAELREILANIEDIHFELRLEDETNMVAEGNIQMVDKTGNSMVESMSFITGTMVFMTDYLSAAGTGQ